MEPVYLLLEANLFKKADSDIIVDGDEAGKKKFCTMRWCLDWEEIG